MTSPFAFRMRAYAAAHLGFDEQLRISWPDAVAMVQSEYTGGPDGRAYPVTLFAEIRGDAESRDGAQEHLSASIGNALPVIALAANAAIDDPLAIAVFGLDLSTPQEFTWYAAPHASQWFPPGKRRIPADATLALMTAVGHHPQTDLLQRAIESYRRALSNWVPERLLMAGEFLYISAETLSRCMLETRSAARDITPRNLARLERASDQDALRARYLRDEVFARDEEAFEAMHAASNGFEHGYMSVVEVRGLIGTVLERSMAAVRRALIATAGVPEDARNVLLGEDYAEPRGLVPAFHVVTGRLRLGDPSKPPSDDLGTLELDFPQPVPEARATNAGEVEIDFRRTVTARGLPENVVIDVEGTGLRAAHVRHVAVRPDGVTRASESKQAE
jgi:hypothetical protein